MSDNGNEINQTAPRWDIPNNWKWVELADISKVITGNTPPTADKVNYGNDLPYVKPPELIDRGIRSSPSGLSKKGASIARTLPAGAVLVSCIGGLGKTGIAKVPVAFNQQINAIVFEGKIVPEFGFYYAQTLKEWLYSVSSATTLPIVNKGKFQVAPFPLAPLNEQTRIVAEIEKQFSRLDEAVANLKRVKANLKRYKSAVLKAAVEGKLSEHSGPYGEKTLASLGKWCGGGTPSKSKTEYWKDGSVPWVSPKDMKVGLISDTEDHITDAAIVGSSTNLLPKGAVLIVTRSGILKHTLPVAVTERAVTINQDLKALQPLELYNPDYIALALRANQQEILHQCTKEGTTVDSVEFPLFLRYQIPIPPLPVQIEIVAEVERRLSIVAGTEAQVDANLRRADRLRQSILKQAFSGQLVPQDPNDEPASVLLERLRAHANVGARRAVPLSQSERPNRARHAVPLRKIEPKPVAPDFACLDDVTAAILSLMQPGREYVRADLADPLGLSTGRWNAAIQDLKRIGKVRQLGEKRGARYELVKAEGGGR